jgi:hypothetical protein
LKQARKNSMRHPASYYNPIRRLVQVAALFWFVLASYCFLFSCLSLGPSELLNNAALHAFCEFCVEKQDSLNEAELCERVQNCRRKSVAVETNSLARNRVKQHLGDRRIARVQKSNEQKPPNHFFAIILALKIPMRKAQGTKE